MTLRNEIDKLRNGETSEHLQAGNTWELERELGVRNAMKQLVRILEVDFPNRVVGATIAVREATMDVNLMRAGRMEVEYRLEVYLKKTAFPKKELLREHDSKITDGVDASSRVETVFDLPDVYPDNSDAVLRIIAAVDIEKVKEGGVWVVLTSWMEESGEMVMLDDYLGKIEAVEAGEKAEQVFARIYCHKLEPVLTQLNWDLK